MKVSTFIHTAEWILLLSQQLLKLSIVCSHTFTKKTPTKLVNCIVNDALVTWSIPCQTCSKRCYHFL